MCTVSYIPTSSGFLLTSNRDEKTIRKTIAPQVYTIENAKILFPKDTLASGSWIAMNKQKRYACLLNGAFEKHERKNEYRKSRGLILLDSFSYSSIQEFISSINLEGIEPFTLLLIDAKEELQFFELKWDEKRKYVREVNLKIAQLWSSSTLYDLETRMKRENLFNDWVTKYRDEDDVNILNFHLNSHDLGLEHGILMKRNDDLQTVSVSQLTVSSEQELFHYHDLLENIKTKHFLHEI